MVAAPCRALIRAARWNGHAPQVATGVAAASEAQRQSWNCSAGTIASSTTGTARATETSIRRRSSRRDPAASSASCPASGGAGSAAV